MPTPEDLSYTPELAALALLAFALEITTRALLAAHPEITEDRIPRTKLLRVLRGSRLMHLASKTRIALQLYRQAVASHRPLAPDATDDLDAISADDFGPLAPR
jgi:hypothetical protein